MTVDAKTFIDALRKLEDDNDVEPIAALFADGADISNPLVEHGGKGGAKAFWSAYRSTFDTIRSEFSQIVEKDGVAMLEWTSAAAVGGKDASYEGVSVIESDGDAITAFRTYFDPSRVGRKIEAAVG